MAGVNKVILIGNLGKDPEVRNLENEVKVASFSLATSESYKTKDGTRVDNTEWHNIVLWRGLAGIAEKYLKKGDSIYLEGKLRTRSWEDENGVKKYRTEIYGDQMTMLSKKGDNQSGSIPPPPPDTAQPQDTNVSTEPEDDLPF
jgi:single-strand DNA-binding protein